MGEVLWTGAEIQAALNADSQGNLPAELTGVSFDTRTLQPGDLFFAIKGDTSDGHAYVERAFAAGAPLAVVSRGYDGAAPGPLLRVADTFVALNDLGRAGRNRTKARVAAVTGSVGKTGTKEMLRLMLARLGAVHASEKSYNNHWGVPLTAARLPRSADYAVFEIGMNHADEITPLTHLVRPHVAIITTVVPVHVEYFGSTAAIAEAKAEIFFGLEPNGVAVLNRDNEHYDLLATLAMERGAGTIVRFGQGADTDARLLSLEVIEGGSRVSADILGERIVYQLGAPGEHLAMNSVAALVGVKCLGGDVAQAAEALAMFAAPQGRGAQSVRTCPGGSFLLIDESYNANPASMAAAFKVLASLSANRVQRRIVVLGDMLELGANTGDIHRALNTPIENCAIDAVFCAGVQMRALFNALDPKRRAGWAETSADLKDALIQFVKPGDAITVKGSNGSRMGPLVEALKQEFPEVIGTE
jgi:UDP-N-acetylmuramoyl-tripeptide--D-alanyl-D-alanine ligase